MTRPDKVPADIEAYDAHVRTSLSAQLREVEAHRAAAVADLARQSAALVEAAGTLPAKVFEDVCFHALQPSPVEVETLASLASQAQSLEGVLADMAKARAADTLGLDPRLGHPNRAAELHAISDREMERVGAARAEVERLANARRTALAARARTFMLVTEHLAAVMLALFDAAPFPPSLRAVAHVVDPTVPRKRSSIRKLLKRERRAGRGGGKRGRSGASGEASFDASQGGLGGRPGAGMAKEAGGAGGASTAMVDAHGATINPDGTRTWPALVVLIESLSDETQAFFASVFAGGDGLATDPPASAGRNDADGPASTGGPHPGGPGPSGHARRNPSSQRLISGSRQNRRGSASELLSKGRRSGARSSRSRGGGGGGGGDGGRGDGSRGDGGAEPADGLSGDPRETPIEALVEPLVSKASPAHEAVIEARRSAFLTFAKEVEVVLETLSSETADRTARLDRWRRHWVVQVRNMRRLYGVEDAEAGYGGDQDKADGEAGVDGPEGFDDDSGELSGA